MKGLGKKIGIGVLIVALLVGGFYGVRFIQRSTKPVSVYPVSMIMSSVYDESAMYGTVGSGSSETYRKSTAIVKEVFVKPGQEVKSGDSLFRYDTASLRIEAERAANDLEIARLNLDKAKAELARYQTYRPYTPIEPYYVETTEEIFSFDDAKDPNAKGTLEDPIVFVCSPLTRVNMAFLIGQVMDVPLLTPSQQAELINQGEEVTPGEESEETPEDPSEGEPEEPSEDEQPKEELKPGENAKVVKFEIWQGNPDADMVEIFTWLVNGPETSSVVLEGLKNELYSMWSVGDGLVLSNNQVSEFTELPFALGKIGDKMPETPTIPENRSYTQEEINEMIAEANRRINTLKVSVAQAEIRYKRASRASSDGIVRTECNGVIGVVENYDSLNSGDVFMTVLSDSGFVILGTVNELKRNEIEIGSEVIVTSMMSGEVFPATISYVSDTPATSYGGESENNSSYPFKANISMDAEISVDDWVQISFQSNDSESFYIPKMFVVMEKGEAYVMKAVDGVLVKQKVKTGKMMWGSEVQILEGLTPDDYIAFPYGKKVKEGAPCDLAEDMSELYG